MIPFITQVTSYPTSSSLTTYATSLVPRPFLGTRLICYIHSCRHSRIHYYYWSSHQKIEKNGQLGCDFFLFPVLLSLFLLYQQPCVLPSSFLLLLLSLYTIFMGDYLTGCRLRAQIFLRLNNEVFTKLSFIFWCTTGREKIDSFLEVLMVATSFL